MQNFSGHKKNNWKDTKKQKLDGWSSKIVFVTTEISFIFNFLIELPEISNHFNWTRIKKGCLFLPQYKKKSWNTLITVKSISPYR